MNTLFDFCAGQGIDFEIVKEGMKNDPRIGSTHLDVLHQGGRGAGGHCFPKDAEAYLQRVRELVKKVNDDNDENHKLLLRLEKARTMLATMSLYNEYLLRSSGKDQSIVDTVYGI